MLHEVSFASYNGRDQVQGWIYVPACKPKGIVQVIHGFGEHSRRYLHMISAFMDAGYIVAADDHVGHGKTAMVNNVWGDWGDKGPHTMMEDEHTLKGIVCGNYWKPSIDWIIESVKVLNPIRTERKGIRPIKYNGGNDLSYYTYLSDVAYIISAHFEFNKRRPDLQEDWNENKHYYVAKRAP